MSNERRIKCLQELKRIGFQTGTGIMVGTPRQRVEFLIEDIRFIENFQPEMIGIGPFIPHQRTPFCDEKAGSVELTLLLLSIFRLMHPKALIPSTTALASLGTGRQNTGYSCRRQCGHAQSVAYHCKKQI